MYSLLPMDALREVATAFTMGRDKHAVDDFTLPNIRTVHGEFDALMRHYAAYVEGETHDPETGLNHAAHMAARALILCHLALRREGKHAD